MIAKQRPNWSALVMMLVTLGSAVAIVWPARAERWRDTRRFEPFVCRGDFDLTRQSRLLTDLQRLEQDLKQQLRLEPSGETVELYLFRDRDRYRDYLKTHFPGVSPRRALFVKGRGNGMVFAYRNRELEVDLRHECTHALLHRSLLNVPLWLDEGLAEYFEVPPASRAAAHPHLRTLAKAVSDGNQIPHPAFLELKHELAQMQVDDYRHAWAWVHFMLHGPRPARVALQEYLADLRIQPNPEPLSRRLERELPNLRGRLVEHLRAWSD